MYKSSNITHFAGFFVKIMKLVRKFCDKFSFSLNKTCPLNFGKK